MALTRPAHLMKRGLFHPLSVHFTDYLPYVLSIQAHARTHTHPSKYRWASWKLAVNCLFLVVPSKHKHFHWMKQTEEEKKKPDKQKRKIDTRNQAQMKWNETDENKQYDEIKRSAHERMNEEKKAKKKSVSWNIKQKMYAASNVVMWIRGGESLNEIKPKRRHKNYVNVVVCFMDVLRASPLKIGYLEEKNKVFSCSSTSKQFNLVACQCRANFRFLFRVKLCLFPYYFDRFVFHPFPFVYQALYNSCNILNTFMGIKRHVVHMAVAGCCSYACIRYGIFSICECVCRHAITSNLKLSLFNMAQILLSVDVCARWLIILKSRTEMRLNLLILPRFSHA